MNELIKKITITCLMGLLFLGCSGQKTLSNNVNNNIVNSQDENSVVSEKENNEEHSEIVLEGEITETTVINSSEDVLLHLKNVTANMEQNVISVENAKSVTIIIEGDNTLESTGDVTTVEPKVILSNADLVIKGDGVLNITSTATAIKSKANLTIESGTFNLTAGSDGNGLRADDTMTIEGGTFNINAGECLEATYININDGEFNLNSTDDAINASNKIDDTDTSIVPVFTMNDGSIVITMAQGDTDGIDSNGDIIINGGAIDITGQSGFDWDGNLTFKDGVVIVNGERITQITNSMPMGDFAPGHGHD